MERSMNDIGFDFCGAALRARASGALWWPERQILVVSDLHLGKSDRIARRSGAFLPPYETRDTLNRLQAEIDVLSPATVLCLGDSFDDLQAAAHLSEPDVSQLTRLMAGRRWIWAEGNHDPGPVDLGGTHLAELAEPPLVFRHIALPGARAEISGHYHPKARVVLGRHSISRACFLVDADRIILPAFGTYTGGLNCTAEPLKSLMRTDAQVFLTGQSLVKLPASAAA